MTQPARDISNFEIPFSDDDFNLVAKFARNEFGLSLAESKKPLVYSRLTKRLKAKNINDFKSYLNLIAKSEDQIEKRELISALTTNVTHFFREPHHFETLEDQAKNNWINRLKNGDRIRVWSAGCSHGQEPYSIAMTLLKAIPNATSYDIKILATDIDPKAVQKARDATYDSNNSEGLPNWAFKKYTQPKANQFSLVKEVREIVTFAELNLIRPWPFKGKFDAIFCRNVAIYFDDKTQESLWENFNRILNPDALLFIGHSERITGRSAENFINSGITTYKASQFHQ